MGSINRLQLKHLNRNTQYPPFMDTSVKRVASTVYVAIVGVSTVFSGWGAYSLVTGKNNSEDFKESDRWFAPFF